MSVILASRFSGSTGTDMSRAYMGTFAIALVLMAATVIPAGACQRGSGPQCVLIRTRRDG